MPIIPKRGIPKDDPEYKYKSWMRGYNTYQPKNKIRNDEMSDAQNVEIFINSVEKRRGAAYVGNSKDSRTRGLAIYTHSGGTKKIIRASGTTIQEFNTSTENFDNITGKTYTSDLNTNFIQAHDDLFILNGTDNLTKYNKDDSPNITTYTSIGPPTSPTATRGAGLSTGNYKAYYVITSYNNIGETLGTTEFSTDFDIKRSAWDAATEIVTLAWTDYAGATGVNIFYSSTTGDTTYLDTVEAGVQTYEDIGGALEPDGLTEPPETNSTAGVIAENGTFDGTRIWCFKDSTVFYSGGGSVDYTHWDSSSGGGALNVAKGDGDEVLYLENSRDGKIIVYKQFSTWQTYFDSSGIINLKIINSLMGTVGKRAVTVVDDDHVFVSRFGVFTLGNQPNFPTDILRIKSISFPIDKELERVTPGNLPNIVLHYDFKRRLRLAYTEGGATYNNAEFTFKYGAWTPNKGLNINCYLNMVDLSSGTAILDELNKQYTLIGIDNSGRVAQLDKGYSDMGSNIDGYFDTKQDDQGFPERYKKYYDQDIEIGKLQGDLDIYQYFNSGDDLKITISNPTTGGIGSEAIGLSEVGAEYGTLLASSGISLTKRWRLFGRQQKYLRTRFRQDSAIGTFEIMSFSGVYRLKSRRQYDSDDILTTTVI